jgi:hypothetical protein
MVEIAGGVGVGATVLKEAVEMMLIVTTKRSTVLLPRSSSARMTSR